MAETEGTAAPTGSHPLWGTYWLEFHYMAQPGVSVMKGPWQEPGRGVAVVFEDGRVVCQDSNGSIHEGRLLPAASGQVCVELTSMQHGPEEVLFPDETGEMVAGPVTRIWRGRVISSGQKRTIQGEIATGFGKLVWIFNLVERTDVDPD